VHSTHATPHRFFVIDMNSEEYTSTSFISGVFNAWPAGHQMDRGALCRGPPAILKKNNYKRHEIKSNFNDARWPLNYTAVF